MQPKRQENPQFVELEVRPEKLARKYKPKSYMERSGGELLGTGERRRVRFLFGLGEKSKMKPETPLNQVKELLAQNKPVVFHLSNAHPDIQEFARIFGRAYSKFDPISVGYLSYFVDTRGKAVVVEPYIGFNHKITAYDPEYIAKLGSWLERHCAHVLGEHFGVHTVNTGNSRFDGYPHSEAHAAWIVHGGLEPSTDYRLAQYIAGLRRSEKKAHAMLETIPSPTRY